MPTETNVRFSRSTLAAGGLVSGGGAARAVAVRLARHRGWRFWVVLGLLVGVLGCGGSWTGPGGRATAPAPIAAPPSSTAWSFAVMADSQWLGPDDGDNPDSVSVGIINQLNAEFIRRQVKFVVQVGDLTSSGDEDSLDIRATYAQALYNAGIGFFPVRGNHEGSASAARAFLHAFPQTRDGLNNTTPGDAIVATDDDDETRPQARTGGSFQLGEHFTSPSTNLRGLTYAFDFNNTRFVLLDQYTPADGGSNSLAAQQGWLSSTLATRPAGGHAFVFSHQGLICPYQPDSLVGTFPAASFESMFRVQDAFIGSLQDNGVRYHIFGHDHFHERNVSTTSDGSGKRVTEIFSAPSANWLFLPEGTQQWYDPVQFPGFRRSIGSQDVNHIGYYIYTVDGANVTVDYYGAEVASTFYGSGNWGSGSYQVDHTPALTFTPRETFGYGQAGREFLVPGGAPLSVVKDTYRGVTAQILGGTNGDPTLDYSGQPLTKAVNSGWRDGPAGLYSPVLTLWGLAPLGAAGKTDAYVLAVQFEPGALGPGVVERGWVGLASPANGKWLNAVDGNVGGTKRFVLGPWEPSCGLGCYGLDPATGTAWAVVNHAGDFAVAPLD